MLATTTKYDASKTKHSLFWSGGAYALTAVLNLAVIGLLVRWLEPAEMALIFIAIPFQDLATLFVDNGLGSYVVQHPTMTEAEKSSCFWQGGIIGLLLAVGLSLSAESLADFFRASELTNALKITAWSFLPIALAFPQKSLLQKNMHFRRIALAELFGMVAACIVTLGLVYQGYKAESYLFGFLARKVVELIFIWTKAPWRPQFCVLPNQIRQLFVFGSFAAGGVMSSYAVRLVDTFIIGRLLGVHALGIYSLANNLIFFPVNKGVATFARVFIAAFSHLKSEGLDAVREAFNKALRNVLTLLLPILFFLAISIEFLLSFFKPTWMATAPIVRILTLYGILIILIRMGEPLLLALNQARLVFWINGVSILLTSLLLWVFTPYGIEWAAWAVVLGSVAPVLFMLRYLQTTIGFSWREFIHVKKPG